MRVIIPAAGTGSRLFPFTESVPKGLLRVNGRMLLEYSLELMYKAGIDEVIFVTGFKNTLLESLLLAVELRPPLRFIHNPDYATTNSIVSLSLSRDWWDENFCVIDSDVCFRPQLLQKLLFHSGNNMIIDNKRSWEEIDMKVEIQNGRIWHLDKNIPVEHTSGEFFGLSSWTPSGAKHLAIAIDNLISEGFTNVWYEFGIRAAAKETIISPIYTDDSSQWVEVDTPDDLKLAENFYR